MASPREASPDSTHGHSSRLGRSGLHAGSPRVGLKRQLDHVEQTVSQHAELLSRHERELEAKGEDAAELVRSLEQSLKAAIREIRTEFTQKFTVLSSEMSQLQKQINAQKGEANILSQQNKDVSRRVDEVADQVRDLAAEIVGEEDEEYDAKPSAFVPERLGTPPVRDRGAAAAAGGGTQ